VANVAASSFMFIYIHFAKRVELFSIINYPMSSP